MANGERQPSSKPARQRDRPCTQVVYPQHPRDSLRFKRLSRPHLRRSTAPRPIVAGLLPAKGSATGDVASYSYLSASSGSTVAARRTGAHRRAAPSHDNQGHVNERRRKSNVGAALAGLRLAHGRVLSSLPTVLQK